jgi:hypothetical protein
MAYCPTWYTRPFQGLLALRKAWKVEYYPQPPKSTYGGFGAPEQRLPSRSLEARAWQIKTTSEVADLSESQFSEFADNWRAETMLMSSPTQRSANLWHLRILTLGKRAIPFVIAEMQKRDHDWFSTMMALAGEDAAEAARTFDEGVDMWVSWAAKKGYV